MTTRTGRPQGSGIDDESALDAVEAARKDDPDLSQRAAIIAQVGNEAHLVRRIERKLADRARMRAGDIEFIASKPFEKGEPRSTYLWSCVVDVPVEGREGIAVTHSVVVGLPVMLVVENEEPIEGAKVPEHHVLRAVDRLPLKHDWNDPAYRACCTVLGIDPDRGRGCFTPRLEAEAAKLRELALSQTMPKGLDTAVVEDIINVTRKGKLSPHGLARLHARYEGDDSAEAIEARAESRAAFNAIDWPRSGQYTTLRWLAGPWGFDHHASIYFAGDAQDGLSSLSPHPEFIVAPDAEDWVSTHAARLTERHCMAVVLSPAEMDAFISGGDRAYWLAIHDWHTKPNDRALAEVRRPDLSMTHALLDAMTANAYAMYVARASRIPLPPDAPLSHEIRSPLTPSQPRPKLQMVSEAVRHGWREILGREASRKRPKESTWDIATPWGPVLAIRRHGVILVRNAGDPLMVGSAWVRLSCEVRPAFAWRGVPQVNLPWFDMTDVKTGKPLPAEDAVPILRFLSYTVCSRADLPGFRGRVLPRSWVLGARALALLCLLALGAITFWPTARSLVEEPVGPTNDIPVQGYARPRSIDGSPTTATGAGNENPYRPEAERPR